MNNSFDWMVNEGIDEENYPLSPEEQIEEDERQFNLKLEAQNDRYLDEILTGNPFEPQLSEAEVVRQIQESWEEDPEAF